MYFSSPRKLPAGGRQSAASPCVLRGAAASRARAAPKAPGPARPQALPCRRAVLPRPGHAEPPGTADRALSQRRAHAPPLAPPAPAQTSAPGAAPTASHPPRSGSLSGAAAGSQTLLQALRTFGFQVQPFGLISRCRPSPANPSIWGGGVTQTRLPMSPLQVACAELPARSSIHQPTHPSINLSFMSPSSLIHPSAHSSIFPSPTPQDRCTWGQQWWLLSLILWGCEIWGSFIISPPTPKFSFGAISPPIFPNTFGKIQALPWHILQPLPSLAPAAPPHSEPPPAPHSPPGHLEWGFFMAFTSLCYFTSIFLSCSMISPPQIRTSLWVPLAAASAQQVLHSQHIPCWILDFPATRLSAMSMDTFPFPLLFYLPGFHTPAQSSCHPTWPLGQPHHSRDKSLENPQSSSMKTFHLTHRSLTFAPTGLSVTPETQQGLS